MRHLSVAIIAFAISLVSPANAGWVWRGVHSPGFGYAVCRVPATAATDGCAPWNGTTGAPPLTWNGVALPGVASGPALNSYQTTRLITGTGWVNSSLQTGSYILPATNVPDTPDYPIGVNWAALEQWAATQGMQTPLDTHSTPALDNPICPGKTAVNYPACTLDKAGGASVSNGWTGHALPAGCSVSAGTYAGGVSGNTLYAVSCATFSSAQSYDLEGWDGGDTYQPGGIPFFFSNNPGGSCTLRNDIVAPVKNVFSFSPATGVANSILSFNACADGLTLAYDSIDFGSPAVWAGPFQPTIRLQSTIGPTSIDYVRMDHAPSRPFTVQGTCVSRTNPLSMKHSSQFLAWGSALGNNLHADTGINVQCTGNTGYLYVEMDYSLMVSNVGYVDTTGEWVGENTYGSTNQGLQQTSIGNVFITNAINIPLTGVFTTASNVLHVTSITNNYNDLNAGIMGQAGNTSPRFYNATYGAIADIGTEPLVDAFFYPDGHTGGYQVFTTASPQAFANLAATLHIG